MPESRNVVLPTDPVKRALALQRLQRAGLTEDGTPLGSKGDRPKPNAKLAEAAVVGTAPTTDLEEQTPSDAVSATDASGAVKMTSDDDNGSEGGQGGQEGTTEVNAGDPDAPATESTESTGAEAVTQEQAAAEAADNDVEDPMPEGWDDEANSENGLTKAQLQAEADKRGIEGVKSSAQNRDEMIAAIKKGLK